MNNVLTYASWFKGVLTEPPHPWQQALGDDLVCRDRLLRVPTGFGKTAGVVLPWLYHRVIRDDLTWPTRLAFVLPMRVLVEQTAASVRAWLSKEELSNVGVEVLMGGEDSDAWLRAPQRPTVLVGTQDMFLSRALNRGYGAGRARWPVDFGLLNQDTLWVMDEVQLMDVGLMTATQLTMFRGADAQERDVLRPCFTWWMSATLQPSWLESVESRPRLPELTEGMLTIPELDRQKGLWDVRKPLRRREDITSPAEIAGLAKEQHEPDKLTLVVVNRVATAIEVYDALIQAFSSGKGKNRRLLDDAPDVQLVHSRFRGAEKRNWADKFLSKNASLPPSGRIIVATQVVEAGVDISARTLVTELAPWPSLVQRFGRCARYVGDEGTIFVVGGAPQDDKKCAPYTALELQAASEGLVELAAQKADASPSSLEHFEEHLGAENDGLLKRLYPYEPDVVLRRHIVEELFDTTPDLTGVDLDVSQYIRSGDERDVTLFWRPVETTKGTGDNRWPREIPADQVPKPQRLELCTAPLSEVKKWLKVGSPAWVLDYPSKTWRRRAGYQLVPGQQVLLPASFGGYSLERGFEPGAKQTVPMIPLAESSLEEEALYQANASEDDDSLSAVPQWKTVAFHGQEVAEVVQEFSRALSFPEHVVHLLKLAGRWHDVGKVHEVFQRAIREDKREGGGGLAQRRDLAKAPRDAWDRYERPGFRHELASTLALFELLRRLDPDHAALSGPYREILALLPESVNDPKEESPLTEGERALGKELAQLTAEDFDLVAWLVCSHHGKVRCSWTSTPKDQEARQGHMHGVGDGDLLSGFEVMDASGGRQPISELTLHLGELASLGLGSRYGASWRERVNRLVSRWGPFQLGYLEAIFRSADWKASALSSEEVIG